MYKISLIGMILSLSLIIGTYKSFADDQIVEYPVSTAEESIDTEQQNKFFTKDVPSIKGLVKSFIIVIALISLFFVFLKWRYGFSKGVKGKKKHIQVLEYAMLGPKRYLYLVKVLDKLLVVGASNDGLSILSEIDGVDKDELLKETVTKGEGFSGFIKKFSGNNNIND